MQVDEDLKYAIMAACYYWGLKYAFLLITFSFIAYSFRNFCHGKGVLVLEMVIFILLSVGSLKGTQFPTFACTYKPLCHRTLKKLKDV